MGSELSEEFWYKLVYQGSVLSPLIFAIADVIPKNAREGLMSEILCANDLVAMSESIENLKEKFLKWKEAFESKGLKMTSRRPKS